MPVIKFTARSVEALKPEPAKQVDYWNESFRMFGARVSPSGRKTWQTFFRSGGSLWRLTLGPCGDPGLSLAEARAKAKETHASVARGKDPAAEKSADRRAETFAELADAYMTSLLWSVARLLNASWCHGLAPAIHGCRKSQPGVNETIQISRRYFPAAHKLVCPQSQYQPLYCSHLSIDFPHARKR
jgi:hypothetical protein